MKPELDKKLVKDFPILYQQRYDDMKATALCWGFPGDGWESLIRRLSEKLEAWNETHPSEWVIATQVKEKFGTLRFYYYMHTKSRRLWKATILPIRSFMFSRKLGKLYWRISDIRKKFWQSPYEKIAQLVCKAEEESEVTCEECGKPGRLRETGWILTLCPECFEEWKERR